MLAPSVALQVTTVIVVTDALFPGATELEGRAIREISALAMDAPFAANSGHSGTAMALAPLGVMLYSRVMRHDPTDDRWSDRDRFIMSNGHASMLQYGLAHVFGYDLTMDDIRNFRQAHSKTPGHPEVGVTPTVEVSTGPLGQGIANGVGMALAERMLRSQFGPELVNHRTWVTAGDGCFMEGVSHEASSLAGSLGLDRLTIFYDDNHITIDGATELAERDDPAERFAAYGWHVINVGEQANDLDALERATREAIAETKRPTLIIIRSHIGFPSPGMMDTREAHGSPFSAKEISITKAILGVPDEPFVDDPDLTAKLLEGLSAQRNERLAWESRVASAGEKGVALLEQLNTNGAATFTRFPDKFAPGSKVATRKAVKHALDVFASQTPGISSGSADLTDNTGVELVDSSIQGALNQGGRQFHYGIREFAMGANMVGQALHGGIRPIGSTFFVFSDYARPSIRLAALSHAPVLFIFTHDSVGVGEDGPTHQPVEQLMALRAMPNLHVVRPSDANEAVQFIGDYLSDPTPAPTALILSRQDVPVMDTDDATASALGARHGGYVVREDPDAVFTLVGTGSEVSLCLEASTTLASQGIATRVVALPCWKCFDAQDAAYSETVMRRSTPSVSIEAGATLGWHKYVDHALGIDTFGMSSPGAVALNFFGINAEAVVNYVKDALGVAP
jgi:transketolase